MAIFGRSLVKSFKLFLWEFSYALVGLLVFAIALICITAPGNWLSASFAIDVYFLMVAAIYGISAAHLLNSAGWELELSALLYAIRKGVDLALISLVSTTLWLSGHVSLQIIIASVLLISYESGLFAFKRKKQGYALSWWNWL
jgi:hypothetical protein